jgi:cathepsin L
VITSSTCITGSSPDHAVVAVGYGTDLYAGSYFIIRNSWGTDWGNKGYLNIGQNKTIGSTGICGLLSSGYNYYPNL